MPAYMTLQRAWNISFASEVRRVMKKPLQLGQAILALRDIDYALKHLCVHHNPLYMDSLALDDFCRHTIAGRHNLLAFTELLVAYIDFRRHRNTRATVSYPICGKDRALRMGETLEVHTDEEGNVFKLGKGIKLRCPTKIMTFQYAVCQQDRMAVFFNRGGEDWSAIEVAGKSIVFMVN